MAKEKAINGAGICRIPVFNGNDLGPKTAPVVRCEHWQIVAFTVDIEEIDLLSLGQIGREQSLEGRRC